MEGFRHILVDGWNAIHAHSNLARMLESEDAQGAQSALSIMLEPIHDFDGARVTIVYDGNGADISIVRKGRETTFSEVYTPSSMTADEFIEQMCATSKRPQDILVVTRDNLLRLTASSFGAMSLSPEKFFEWGKASSGAVKSAAAANNALGAREWKKCNPFSKLDELELDIKSAFRNSPLISKRLKKKISRIKKEGAEHISATTKSAAKPEKTRLADAPKSEFRKPIIGGRAATIKSLSELKDALENPHRSGGAGKKRNRG